MRNKSLIESSSMLKKELGKNNFSIIKSLDVLPKERRKTRTFRASLLKEFGSKCGLCLNDFSSNNLEAAHIVPLELGSSTESSNLILLCKECHRLYDKGYMSINNMFKIHKELLSGKRNTPIYLKNISVPYSSPSITPPPEKIKNTLEEIRQDQIKSHNVIAIKKARKELEKYSEASPEHIRLQIKIAELTRRRAAKGVLKEALNILQSLNEETMDKVFHSVYFYELNYVYRLSGCHSKALGVIKKSSKADISNNDSKELGVGYVAAEVNVLLCELADHEKLDAVEAEEFVNKFNRLTKIASKQGKYWGGRWALNSEAHVLQIYIKSGNANKCWTSLNKLKNQFYSSDITNGWDLGSRKSLSLFDGIVHTLFPRNEMDIHHGVRILSRSFVSRIGPKSRPEGIRDVGYSLAKGMNKLNSEKYSELSDCVKGIMDFTLDGTSYIWPYKANSNETTTT